MFLINRLNKNVLILPQEVIFHAPAGHTYDEQTALPHIIIAEQRFIAPILGRDYYELMIAEKNKLVTVGNQATLLNQINTYLLSIGENPILVTDLPVGAIVNSAAFLSANNLILWNEHLWKLCAEAVETVLIVPDWLRHTPQGQQMNNPEVIGSNGQNSVTGDLKDVAFKEKKFVQDRIDPLVEAMKYFLCKNRTTYTDYKLCINADDADGVAINRKSPIIFGIYDEDEKMCDDEW